MPNVVIGNTPITFPDSATQADWSQPVIDFAEAVQSALTGLVGAADVSPQTFNIASYNGVTGQAIPALTFSTATVRSVVIDYYIYRTTSTLNTAEQGKLTLFYNANNATGKKWEMVREFQGDTKTSSGYLATDDVSTEFSVSDTGQVSFTNQALSGSSHAGLIGFSAKAILQSY